MRYDRYVELARHFLMGGESSSSEIRANLDYLQKSDVKIMANIMIDF